MKINWCLNCNTKAANCPCGAKARIRPITIKAGPLTRRVDGRIKVLAEKLDRIKKAIAAEPSDDRPTYEKAGSIGIEIEGSKEPKEKRSWVIAWRKDEAALTASIADYKAIREIVVAAEEPTLKPDLSLCVEELAYRDMGDMGVDRVCRRPAEGGLCKLHSPETKPKRDARGRILPNGAR